VQQCASGPEGAQLALEAAKATEALNPPHEYAPWLTLNGKPLRDRAYDLKVPAAPRQSGWRRRAWRKCALRKCVAGYGVG
jgi:hypothetical protein